MVKNLNDVREEIDALDNKVLDLLMQRAELIRDVSAIKRKLDRPIVHPAREAMMVRRLLSRHSGIFPQAAVIGIWRELVGAVSMLQRGLNAYISTEGNQTYCWDMAKDYCGSVIPMSRVEKSFVALSFARDDKDAVCVVPWPIDDESNPWWLSLIDQDFSNPDGSPAAPPPLQIIVALPYGSEKTMNHIENKALMVGRMPYLPSGDDHSFIVITNQQPISRARVIDLLKEQGIEAVSIISKTEGGAGAAAHLVEVKGYVQHEDERLSSISDKLSDDQGRCVLIGGFPVPPVLREGDTDPV